MPTDPEVQKIVEACCEAFRTFGCGGISYDNNPIAYALKDKPPTFAADVEVEAVVRFVLMMSKQC